MGKAGRRKNSGSKAPKALPLNGGSPQATAASCPSPPPRGSTKLAGIVNQGATCFLNALLQCLVFTPEFRDAIFHLNTESVTGSEKDATTSIALQLQLLFASLMMEQQQALSSEGLTTSLGWTREQVRQQQDVHEVFLMLMGTLSQSLRGTSKERVLHTLLHTTTVQKITCFTCQKTSKIEAEDSTIFLPVEGSGSLEESLLKNYIFPHVMVGKDQYTGCDICQGPTNALKTTWMQRLPPVLTFALKRFSCTPDYQPYKVVDRFLFPMELDMSQFTEGRLPDTDLLYDLTAVVVHSGNLDTGHYTACVRDIDQLGHWDMRNDQPDQLADEGEAVKAAVQMVATVLALIKKKRSMVPVERLSGAIEKHTGLPWAKSYKKSLGSFTKFLETNHQTFVVEGNQVGLVEGPGTSGQREAGGDTTAPSPAPSSPRNENNMGPSHWYFFNDSDVFPMAAKDVARFFQGQTSAYMLVYRRKNTARPEEAQNNRAFGIPPHVLEAIKKKNSNLTSQRWGSNRPRA